MEISKENRKFLNKLIDDLIEKTKHKKFAWGIYADNSVKTTVEGFDIRIEVGYKRASIMVDGALVFHDDWTWFGSSLGRKTIKLNEIVRKRFRSYTANNTIDKMRENDLILKLSGVK